jgi:hypothetical protein
MCPNAERCPMRLEHRIWRRRDWHNFGTPVSTYQKHTPIPHKRCMADFRFAL